MNYIAATLSVLLFFSFLFGMVSIIFLSEKSYKSGLVSFGLWFIFVIVSLSFIVPKAIEEGMLRDQLVFTAQPQGSDIIQVRVLTDTFQDYYVFRDKLQDFIEEVKIQFPKTSRIYVADPLQHRFRRGGVPFIKWEGGFRYWQADPPGR